MVNIGELGGLNNLVVAGVGVAIVMFQVIIFRA